MTVKEFMRYTTGGMFTLIDADRVGFMTKPYVIIEAGKSVLYDRYGDMKVVYVEAIGKNRMAIYAEKGE